MNWIKENVTKLTNKYKTNNPFQLAEYLNMNVIEKPLGTIRGFYQYYRKNKFIYINSDLDKKLKRVVCAHELGHAILHPKHNAVFLTFNTHCVKGKFEQQANQFAIELLLPDNILSLYELSGITIKDIRVKEEIPEYYVELKK